MDQGVSVIALRVPLIVNRILSFLGLEELKTARRVNSLWKIEAQSYFLQLAVGVIKVGEDDSPSLYVDQYHKYLHQNIKVRIINNVEEQKSIVSTLFSNHGEHIRSLQLMFECPCNMTLLSDCTFLNGTLASVPHLKELTLSIPKCHMHNEQETN
ncbi:hypothetical protein Fcan01_05046 [Folsomia candida]|uniref:F-box domain-containing protein n=1 Tax=Folsomia candida TaxID=158441 RepID=A0A226EQV0_FOLCA|nr:hypothetical protein Fcan01_05046 [Folsomia candida]